MLVLLLWLFPRVWYTRADERLGQFWLTEQTALPGWAFQEVPVSKSAEAILVADRLFNGEFTTADGAVARVFSAKRYSESQNEIGLFVHTPDRCWTESGWKMEPVQPETRELDLHGIPLVLERRVFTSGGQRELVYFTGLVGGQPLPYRLDHNLSVGMKHALESSADKTGTALRASDQRFWSRIWDSFLARRPLVGPKQFLRISTPILDGDVSKADALLTSFLPLWLQPAPFQAEMQSWVTGGGQRTSETPGADRRLDSRP
jgi:hypothetical protein